MAAGDGWKTSPPQAQGLDPERLATAFREAAKLPGCRSLLVARNGHLVGEAYFRGASRRQAHNVKSASKSILSALVGIALREGHLQSLAQRVEELLPAHFPPRMEAGKGKITLRHLLTMSSGLASTSGEHYGAWVSTQDWVRAALARPLLSPPGTEFRYSTGNSHLLSAILTEATGRSTLAFGRRHLFDPLGIRVQGWLQDPKGYYFGGNEMSLTPRDLARFGQLYLDGGSYGGKQLVPREWVEESTRSHAEGWPDRYGAYGYLWWVREEDPYTIPMAVGYGGQFLYLVPDLNLLIVMTSSHVGRGPAGDRKILTLFREHVLGAVKVEKSGGFTSAVGLGSIPAESIPLPLRRRRCRKSVAGGGAKRHPRLGGSPIPPRTPEGCRTYTDHGIWRIRRPGFPGPIPPFHGSHPHYVGPGQNRGWATGLRILHHPAIRIHFLQFHATHSVTLVPPEAAADLREASSGAPGAHQQEPSLRGQVANGGSNPHRLPGLAARGFVQPGSI